MKIFGLVVILVALVAFSPFFYPPTDPQADFYIFRRAGVALLQGRSPYLDPLFFSPVYVAALMIPYALLSPDLAYRLNVVIVYGLLYAIAYKYTKNQAISLMLLYCGAFRYTWLWGNIDYMPLLGGLVNPLLGIWLAMSKPQVGFLLYAFLAVQLARRYGTRSLVYSIMPLLFVIGAALNSNWLALPTAFWNVSIFPYGLIVAAPLLLLAIHDRDKLSALSAATFSTPYLGQGSYSSIMIWAGRNFPAWLVLLFVVANRLGYQ